MFRKVFSMFWLFTFVVIFMTHWNNLLIVNAESITETKGTIIYVDQDATGSEDGSSWQNAFTNLQDALQVAVAPQQIWVAGGLYKPTNSNDREIFFNLKSGVHLFGGFTGDETVLEEREATNPPTVLSGDLLGNDDVDALGVRRSFATSLDDPKTIDNSYHVVACNGITSITNLDSFTITAGHANDESSIHGSGAGIVVYECGQNLRMSNIKIIGNSAYNGGAMYNQGSSPMMMNLTIHKNRAFTSGGGVFNSTNTNPTIRETSIRGNLAVYGGGIYNYMNSNTIANSLFSGNVATQAGGAVYNYFSSGEYVNVTIAGNFSGLPDSGGGTYNLGAVSKVKFVNSILYGNLPTQYTNAEGVMSVSYSAIQGGYSGVGNISIDPLFINPITAQNTASTGGDYHLSPFSPCVDTGLNDAVQIPILYLYDLDRNLRIFDADQNGVATVDMGAYESQKSSSRIFLPLLNK